MTERSNFGGSIERYHRDSTPWWPDPAAPRRRRAQRGGGAARRPRLRAARLLRRRHRHARTSTASPPSGLRFTNFHVTPLCSPTRAALLTGRNHHEVGMRRPVELRHRLPAPCAATSPTTPPPWREVLRRRRATPPSRSASGTSARWSRRRPPGRSTSGRCQRGFDRFYGFLDGETDQFHPELVHDNHHVDPPATVEEGYHLTEDLVDHAIGFVHDIGLDPTGPSLLPLPRAAARRTPRTRRRPTYLAQATGAATTRAGTSPASGCLARQLADRHRARPAPSSHPRNTGVDAWDDLPGHRSAAWPCRLQEAFAAFLDHTDDQLGRLLDALDVARASSTTRSSCSCRTTAPARRAARSACCTR
ncbi:MAG: sulfatase-like hydrolase/transferase [Microthrixaceae bacterium]